MMLVFFALPCMGQGVQTSKIMDMRGVEVSVPVLPKRVATISDGFVEAVMTHLGVVDRVKAIASWSMKRDYSYSFVSRSGQSRLYSRGWNTMKYLNPWLDSLPCFNSPAGNILSFEALAAADPDLVILRLGDTPVGAGNREAAAKVIGTIEALGLPLVVLYSPTWFGKNDLSTIKEEAAIIGRVFGQEAKAKSLGDYLYSTVELVSKRTASIPEAKKTKILYLGLNPDTRKKGGTGLATGQDTPESYIIEAIAGAKNVFRERGSDKILNIEQIYALDPDVIILPTSNGYHPPVELYESPDFALLSELRAVKSRRVYAMPWTPMNASRRLEYPLDILIIAKAAYPELFADIKVHEFALSLYKGLYGVSDADAKGLRSAQWLDWTLDYDF
ncbi:iron ABC transporter substrate-binding protein [Spirochaetota bacterium]